MLPALRATVYVTGVTELAVFNAIHAKAPLQALLVAVHMERMVQIIIAALRATVYVTVALELVLIIAYLVNLHAMGSLLVVLISVGLLKLWLC